MSRVVRAIDESLGLYELSSGSIPLQWIPWNVTRRFTISQWVGGGSYGQVCRGVDRDNGNAPVVIKRVSDVFQTSEDALRILREVAILRRLDHPNIVKVVDIIEPEPNTNPSTNRMRPFQALYVVFQDGGGDLKMWLQMPEQQAVPLSADAVRSLMKQLVGAVGYLHRCRVVHRDIKPANILIDPATLTLRVADFGLSRIIEVSDQEEHQGHHHRVWNFERPRAPSVDDMDEASPVAAESFGNVEPLSRGDSGSFESDDSDVESDSPGLLTRNSTPVVVTSWYRAPEIGVCRGCYSQSIDVWSIGCVFAEILHYMQPRPLLPNRVLFPGNSCRSETRDYCGSIHANEMLGKFHSVLGAPSQTDVEELARMAGDVIAGRTVFFKSSSESARQQAVEQTVRLLTNGYSRLVPGPAVDFSVRYSQAHADCPSALMLLSQMLSYSPSKRISCSQALRHDFLNPGHADVTVDGTVGDDGHERAKRTAVKLKQLDIEALCQDRKTRIRDRDKIAQLLILEAELIKLPARPYSGRSGLSRTPSAASISLGDGRESC